MKKDNIAKENILKGVKRKLRRRDMKIIGASIISCMVIALIGYFVIFVWQHPLSADQFSEVSIERVVETINEMDSRELTYNHLKFTLNQTGWYSFINKKEQQFYIEENPDQQTTSLYFYLSESYMQRYQNKNFQKDRIKFLKSTIESEEEYKRYEENGFFEEKPTSSMNMLLNTKDCNTNIDIVTKEITKVYYLVFDYDHFKLEKFEKAKKDAVLLWEKDAN